MSNTAQHILRTLAYFDIFRYPLSREEVREFHAEPVLQQVVDTALDMLCAGSYVYQLDEFYSLQNDRRLLSRRREGNKRAMDKMTTAYKAAHILSRFPYVEGLAISGSLSKKFAEEGTDVDFFIITSTNRLWIARTIMHFYKKLTFITGRQHWFCMNYYVDSNAMEIAEKNIFTSMEILTLLPTHGEKAMTDFLRANAWAKDYLPLCSRNCKGIPEPHRSAFSRIIEWLFNNTVGDRLDNYLMKITGRRWEKKAIRSAKSGKNHVIGMKVGKHFSKPDPKNFQAMIIERYRQKIGGLAYPHTELIKVG